MINDLIYNNSQSQENKMLYSTIIILFVYQLVLIFLFLRILAMKNSPALYELRTNGPLAV